MQKKLLIFFFIVGILILIALMYLTWATPLLHLELSIYNGPLISLVLGVVFGLCLSGFLIIKYLEVNGFLKIQKEEVGEEILEEIEGEVFEDGETFEEQLSFEMPITRSPIECPLVREVGWRPKQPLFRSGYTKFHPEAIHIMENWLYTHLTHPYPNAEEKNIMARQTGLNVLQIRNWFFTARKNRLEQYYLN